MHRRLRNPNLIYKETSKNREIIFKVRELMAQEVDSNIGEEDYQNIADILQSVTFNKLLEVLPRKESIVAILKFGYVEGKCYSTNIIAKYLEITIEEVRDIVRKVLLLYKERINILLNNMVTSSNIRVRLR